MNRMWVTWVDCDIPSISAATHWNMLDNPFAGGFIYVDTGVALHNDIEGEHMIGKVFVRVAWNE